MPREIQNITNESGQTHRVLFNDIEVILTLRFLSQTECWIFNVEFDGKKASGIRLCLGVAHMISRNFPFDFIVVDNSTSQLDAFRIDDFSEGRCSLILLDNNDMEIIRDAKVPI